MLFKNIYQMAICCWSLTGSFPYSSSDSALGKLFHLASFSSYVRFEKAFTFSSRVISSQGFSEQPARINRPNARTSNFFNINPHLRNIILILLIIFTVIILLCQPSYAAEAKDGVEHNTAIVEKVLKNFMEVSESWAFKLEGSAKKLFSVLFTLEVAMLGITALLKRQEIEDIILNMATAFLFGGFILLCISNYAEWSADIMNGMAGIANLTGNYDSQKIFISPLHYGLDIFKEIMKSVKGWQPMDMLGKLLAGFAILISFAFITLNIVYIKCEAAVAVGAGFILLGFGGCHFFKDYAINLMRYILSVAFKLYVLYMVLGLGFTFIDKTLSLSAAVHYEELAVILITALIILTLSKSLPDVAAGIINGAHVNTGGNLMSTTKQVMTMAAVATAATAAGAVGGTKGAASGLENIKQAVGVAKGAGATGFGGVTKGAFEALRDAGKQLKADTQGPTLGSKLEAMREAQRLKIDPPASPAAPAKNPLSEAQNAARSGPQPEKPSSGELNDVQKKNNKEGA